jgi:hypothetical protein
MYKFVRSSCNARARWGLTGTPFRNSSNDLRAQLWFLHVPGARAMSDRDVFTHMAFVAYGKHTQLLPAWLLVDKPTPLDPREWDLYAHLYDYSRAAIQRAPAPGFNDAAMVHLQLLAISLDLVPLDAVDKMRMASTEHHVPGTLGRWWSAAVSVCVLSAPLSIYIYIYIHFRE